MTFYKVPSTEHEIHMRVEGGGGSRGVGSFLGEGTLSQQDRKVSVENQLLTKRVIAVRGPGALCAERLP